MFKQLLIVALIALGTQAQTYCEDQALRCRVAATTRPESEACGIREQACAGSKIWVPECPKAVPAVTSKHHHHHEKKEKESVVKANIWPFPIKPKPTPKPKPVPKCNVPCNNNWIICDEIATTAADMAECQIRKQACQASS